MYIYIFIYTLYISTVIICNLYMLSDTSQCVLFSLDIGWFERSQLLQDWQPSEATLYHGCLSPISFLFKNHHFLRSEVQDGCHPALFHPNRISLLPRLWDVGVGMPRP